MREEEFMNKLYDVPFLLSGGNRDWQPRVPVLSDAEKAEQSAVPVHVDGRNRARKPFSGEYGCWTVIEYDTQKGRGYWKCRCKVCGTTESRTKDALVKAMSLGRPPRCNHR